MHTKLHVRWLPGALVACFLLLTALALAPGAAAQSPEPLTEGEFLQQIAGRLGLDASSPQAAVESLRANGHRVPDPALDRPLTEGRVAEIGRALGLRLRTSTPQAPFTRRQAETFLRVLGPQLMASAGADAPDPQAEGEGSGSERGADPLTKGKGKKKGLLKRTPSDPVDQ